MTLTKPQGNAAETKTYVNLLTDVITKDRTLPDGYDGWAIRSVRPDFTSSNGYRYPYPGKVAKAPGPINKDHKDECPSDVGDGICAALDWAGMASGGIPARNILLTAFKSKHVLGRSPSKLRLSQFLVVDVIDGDRLVREHGRGAYLSGAYLRSADLRSADLRSAHLSGAYLRSADLRSAHLSGADLSGAHLSGANLYGANLFGAHLGAWERGPDGYARRKS